MDSDVMVAAADLGCVGGPVPGGGSLPFDGDGDVDAEGAGEDGGGQLGGELEQRGRAGFREPDAEIDQRVSCSSVKSDIKGLRTLVDCSGCRP
ncbi:hypothetical protein ACFYOR_34905 [Streptomyces griseofuscus]|uniref:hypothetical protein n=1 Tax=Streptomyces griseofuscus TaxID=146922 RepID=UPI0036B81C21